MNKNNHGIYMVMEKCAEFYWVTFSSPHPVHVFVSSAARYKELCQRTLHDATGYLTKILHTVLLGAWSQQLEDTVLLIHVISSAFCRLV